MVSTVASTRLNPVPLIFAGGGRYFIALLLLLITANSYSATLRNEVDRSSLKLGESVELNVVFSEQTMFGEPDFGALEKDFKILSRNRRSQYSNVNGRAVASTRWILNLSPRRIGTLLIPSFKFKGEISNALEISVEKAQASTQHQGARVFTETILDKSTVYVQEQALLTLRFYTSIALSNFTIGELALPGAQLIKVAESRYQKDLDGQTYTVVETRYAIFVDNSTTLEIPAIQYSGVIADRSARYSGSLFQQRGKQAFYRSEAKQLEVKPMPSKAAQRHWLPGSGLTLQERWSHTDGTVTLGEPLTRTITITGQSLMASQLPPLSMPNSKSYKLYPDQAQLENAVSNAGVIGKRIESIAIVPTQTGSITLPDIAISWWDTESKAMRETVLKGRTLEVLPASEVINQREPTAAPSDILAPSNEAQQNTADTSANIYLWVLAASNFVLLIIAASFGFLWWRNRPAKTAQAPEKSLPRASDKALFRNIRMACATDDYPALRQAIIEWARVHWHHAPLNSLEQVAELANNDTLRTEFKALDARLYSNSETQKTVSSDTIFRQLDDLRKSGASSGANSSAGDENDRRQHLQPLYPRNS